VTLAETLKAAPTIEDMGEPLRNARKVLRIVLAMLEI
jgi:hypothetical protein